MQDPTYHTLAYSTLSRFPLSLDQTFTALMVPPMIALPGRYSPFSAALPAFHPGSMAATLRFGGSYVPVSRWTACPSRVQGPCDYAPVALPHAWLSMWLSTTLVLGSLCTFLGRCPRPFVYVELDGLIPWGACQGIYVLFSRHLLDDESCQNGTSSWLSGKVSSYAPPLCLPSRPCVGGSEYVFPGSGR